MGKDRQVVGGSRAGEQPTIKGPRGVSEGVRLLYPDYGGSNVNLYYRCIKIHRPVNQKKKMYT